MKNTEIDNYLGIIKAEMIAEYIETIDRAFIKEVVLRAGGKVADVDTILKHDAVKEIDDDMFYARKLFEKTGQVVYTVGHEGNVALTCQARPQEGEVFGEFPVRLDLAKYTRYPVLVPSPTPAYNCHYESDFLIK